MPCSNPHGYSERPIFVTPERNDFQFNAQITYLLQKRGDVNIIHTFATHELPVHASYHYFLRSVVSLHRHT